MLSFILSVQQYMFTQKKKKNTNGISGLQRISATVQCSYYAYTRLQLHFELQRLHQLLSVENNHVRHRCTIPLYYNWIFQATNFFAWRNFRNGHSESADLHQSESGPGSLPQFDGDLDVLVQRSVVKFSLKCDKFFERYELNCGKCPILQCWKIL